MLAVVVAAWNKSSMERSMEAVSSWIRVKGPVASRGSVAAHPQPDNQFVLPCLSYECGYDSVEVCAGNNPEQNRALPWCVAKNRPVMAQLRRTGSVACAYRLASTASALEALRPGPGSTMTASTVPSRRIIA